MQTTWVESVVVHSGRHGQITLAAQAADTRWVRCSEEVEYQSAINGPLQQLREKDATDIRGVQSCPAILPRPITSWYMLHDTKYWDDDALYENHARASLPTMQKTLSGSHEPVIDPGM